MLISKNRKAHFDYEILDTVVAGVVLKGYEVKAIREGKAKLEGSFVRILDSEPYVVNMYIGRYSTQSQDDDQYDKSRKLLLNENELSKLKKELGQKGKTAIPLALILKNNIIKLEFGIVRGRKEFEKKAVTKERAIKKDLDSQRKELGL